MSLIPLYFQLPSPAVTLIMFLERSAVFSYSLQIEKQDILERVNDTVIIFSSPQVPEHYPHTEVISWIKMDGFETPLYTAELSFAYVEDPTFDNFTDGIMKQVNNLIHAKVNHVIVYQRQ